MIYDSERFLLCTDLGNSKLVFCC